MRSRHAITKKHALLYVFNVLQPNTVVVKKQKAGPFGAAALQGSDPNGNIFFVDMERFRPCLSKPSYRAPKRALLVRLMQKEGLKSPHKSLIIENQASWVILAILASHFRARVDTPTKSPIWGLA